MKVGDLIQLSMAQFGAAMFEWWGRHEKHREVSPIVAYFKEGQFGILLEDLIQHGGNGCKVLTSDGLVGWVYRDQVMTTDQWLSRTATFCQ